MYTVCIFICMYEDVHYSHKVTNHFAFLLLLKYGVSYWQTFVRILKTILIPNMLIPHLSSLANNFKRGDYCYTNGPKIKLQ